MHTCFISNLLILIAGKMLSLFVYTEQKQAWQAESEREKRNETELHVNEGRCKERTPHEREKRESKNLNFIRIGPKEKKRI
jgi:hypothetical protein